MSDERKSLTDFVKDIQDMPVPYETKSYRITSINLSYTKISKLITAVYMVTDIMDRDEPIRLKLRTLGADIISDIGTLTADSVKILDKNITVTLSLLNIAHDVGMVSEMNCNILKKEFEELQKSLQESLKNYISHNRIWLEEFLRPSDLAAQTSSSSSGGVLSEDNLSDNISPKGHFGSNGHSSAFLNNVRGTKIGLQKGNTLMKALDKVSNTMSDSSVSESDRSNGNYNQDKFKILKNKRREEIVSTITDNKNIRGINGSTITDIKKWSREPLASCGEKTLQRELISMVSDSILYRTGSKRWSKYFIKIP